MDSILTSIKKLLGIAEEQTDFDTDIVFHINSVFSILAQLGVGPSEGFSIENEDATWDDFISDASTLRMVRTYIYMKVRFIFDPPTNATLTAALKESIEELEWRLMTAADPKLQNGGEGDG